MTRLFGRRLVSMGQKLARSIQKITELLIASPCTALCSMDDKSELCTGCYRTLDEIMHWSQFSGEKKHAVNKAAADRRAAAQPITPR
ncbi:MAG: DUF1289 domain-containing protein [Spirochaetota bacterium]